jgi:hypothetical protein
MGYGEELVRVTVGQTVYVIYEPFCSTGSYDIHVDNKNGDFRLFGLVQDPKYLDEKTLETYIRECMRIRTGIPG